jgi:hypothetical protein
MGSPPQTTEGPLREQDNCPDLRLQIRYSSALATIPIKISETRVHRVTLSLRSECRGAELDERRIQWPERESDQWISIVTSALTQPLPKAWRTVG